MSEDQPHVHKPDEPKARVMVHTIPPQRGSSFVESNGRFLMRGPCASCGVVYEWEQDEITIANGAIKAFEEFKPMLPRKRVFP